MAGETKLTIKDIAEALGVSISTVSRAINGKKGVGEELRKKILDYVNEKNYRPNQVAQSLSGNPMKIIGMVLGDIRNPFYTELVFKIQKLLNERGYMVVCLNSEYNVEREAEHLKMMGQFNFAGLILITVQSEKIKSIMDSMNMPKVLVNRILPDYNGDSVLIDNFQAGYAAVIHLLDLGHNHIGFIRGPELSSASSLRFDGFVKALSNYNIEIDQRFIYDSSLKIEDGRKAAKSFIEAEKDRPTAIIAVNDLTAIGFIDECKKNGLGIPQDVSVLSFDNTWVAALEGINLTSMSQNVEEMSKQTVRLLLKQIKGDTDHPERVIIPHHLILRGSTGPVR